MQVMKLPYSLNFLAFVVVVLFLVLLFTQIAIMLSEKTKDSG